MYERDRDESFIQNARSLCLDENNFFFNVSDVEIHMLRYKIAADVDEKIVKKIRERLVRHLRIIAIFMFY